MEMAVTKNVMRSVAVGLFHEWAGCCSILSTPPPLSGTGRMHLLYTSALCFRKSTRFKLYLL